MYVFEVRLLNGAIAIATRPNRKCKYNIAAVKPEPHGRYLYSGSQLVDQIVTRFKRLPLMYGSNRHQDQCEIKDGRHKPEVQMEY